MLGIALRDSGLTLADLRALARGADDAGYSTIWIPEASSRDALVVAGILGAATKNARVGTGVVPLYSRNAVALALAAATVAEACEGRFVLGLGAGQRAAAESWFGAGWDHPRTRMRETVDVVQRILHGERVCHNGRVNVDGFHLGSKPPPVPIHLAALTPRTLRLAGQVADGVLLEWMPVEGLGRCALLAREAAADAGRTVDVGAYVRVAVADTDDDLAAATAALRDEVYLYASLPGYANAMRQHGLAREVERLHDGDDSALDGLVRALCAVGSAEDVRARVRELDSAGIDEIVVYPVAYGTEPAESVLHTIRALA